MYLFYQWFLAGWKNPIQSFKDLALGFTFIPYDGPLWYLFAIFILLIFVPLISKLREHAWAQGLLFIIILGLSLYFNIFYSGNLTHWTYWWWVSRTVSYVPAYFLGALLGLNQDLRKRFEQLSTSRVKYFAALLYLVSLGILLYRPSTELMRLIQEVQPLFVWVMIDQRWFKKDISELMKFNFLIYASQRLLLNLLSQKLYSISPFLPPRAIVAFLFPLVVTGAIYVINLVLYKVLKRVHLPKMGWLLLTGGRG